MAEITRRHAIAAGGALALGLIGCGGDDDKAAAPSSQPSSTTATEEATSATADCTLTPEQTEGPYYLDGSQLRSDIKEDREGTTLRLELTVVEADKCEPIQNATVEVWHCDAEGVYSGVDGGSGMFLRGGQKTGRDGVASFETIYPGWYQGRTTHVHVKVHVSGNEVHTGQLYFPDETNAAVAASGPYAGRGEPDTTNDSDGIYEASGLVKLAKQGEGYVGSLTMGVQV